MSRVSDVLRSISAGQIPAGIADDCECREEVMLLIDYLADISRFVLAMSAGDLSATINRRGALAGDLKGLHANLRHLTWQTQQVAGGDFKQRVDFLGEFSIAFNSMVVSLNQARDDLIAKNQQLAEAFDELKSTQVQLLQQAKMASVGQLAAGVAHEINNPMGFITSNLNTLHGYGESLASYVASADQLVLHNTEDARFATTALRKSLDLDFLLEDMPLLIDESVKGAIRVRDIVLALRHFSNLDSSVEQKLDLNDCLENTIAVAGNSLTHPSRLVRDFGSLPPVVGNPQELGQLFLNLLINADQAIANGGEIKVSTHSDEKFVFLTVSDTGVGIPEDAIGRIFEPFFTTRPVGKGVGLGLSIAYGIVQEHGGWIDVASRPGEGSCFTVFLPEGPKSCRPTFLSWTTSAACAIYCRPISACAILRRPASHPPRRRWTLSRKAISTRF